MIKGEKQMETILKLWRGQLSEVELADSAVREKIKLPQEEKVIQEADQFEKSLSEEQKRLLLSYWQMESGEWSAEVDEAFIIGFKIGSRIMMDILGE